MNASGRYRQILAILVLTGAIVFAACAPSSEPESTSSDDGQSTTGSQSSGESFANAVNGIPVPSDAKSGGILRIATTPFNALFLSWEEVASLASTSTPPISNTLVETRAWGTVTDFNNAAYLEVVPSLAESWEQSADGLSWTFIIRDGITFSDGTPLTCSDAQWSLDTIRTGTDLTRSPRAVHFSAVTSIICADDRTLVLNLNQPKPTLIDLMAFGYNQIYPKALYANDLELLRNDPFHVATGPFTLTEYLPGERLTFARKENYWNQPFPFLDGIQLQILDRQAQNSALRAGRLDLTSDSLSYSGSAADTLVAECDVCQVFDARAFTAGLGTVLHVNHQRAPWNTSAVKDALSLAIDRVKFRDIGRSEGWGAAPITGLFYPGSGWEMPYDRVKVVPGYNVDTPDENKERARELLANAGYGPGELTIRLGIWSVIQGDLPPIIEDLQLVGFNVDSTVYETARNYEILTDGSFDVYVMSFARAPYYKDFSLYEHYYTGSDRNYGRYSNPEIDRLIDEVSRTLDPEAQRQKAWNVADILLRDHAKIILNYPASQPIYGERVRNYMPVPVALVAYGPWARYEYVWLQ